MPKPYTVLEGAERLPRSAVEQWHPGVKPVAADVLLADRLWLTWDGKVKEWRRHLAVLVGCTLLVSLGAALQPVAPVLVVLLLFCGGSALAAVLWRRALTRARELAQIRSELLTESNAQFQVKEVSAAENQAAVQAVDDG